MRYPFLPTIGELVVFSACVRTGATTRASEELGLTQSAVSRALSSLERRLGVRLFHRIRQRLVLSDAGRAFSADAELTIQQLRQASIAVMAFGGRTDLVRLAVLPTIGTAWLVPRLIGFRNAYPDVTIDIVSRVDPINFDDEPFDAALQRLDMRSAGVLHDDIMEERLVVVASPALVPSPVADTDLVRLPLLQQTTRPTLWLDWFRDTAIDPRVILRGDRFEHFGMLIAAAIAGLGVALVPEKTVVEEIAERKLVLASPRHLSVGASYALLYPESSRRNPAFTAFRAWLQGETVGHQPPTAQGGEASSIPCAPDSRVG